MDDVAIAKLNDIQDGDYRVFACEGLEVGLFRTGSKVLAYENVCPHAGGPVCQGTLMNRVTERLDSRRRIVGDDFADELHIVCPWHGYEYDVRTGEHPADSRLRLRSIEVEECEGEILVRL